MYIPDSELEWYIEETIEAVESALEDLDFELLTLDEIEANLQDISFHGGFNITISIAFESGDREKIRAELTRALGFDRQTLQRVKARNMLRAVENVGKDVGA